MERRQRRRMNSITASFPQFSELDDDMMMHIISFIADAPMENTDIRPPRGAMTNVLPIVNKKFHAFCQADYFWQAALKRLCATEPFLWEEGLLRLLPPGSKAKTNAEILVDDAYKMLQNLNYKSLYRRVFQTHIRFTGPVFFMTGAIRLGQGFGLHFFEHRYRLLIAEVMRGWPESARRGEVITASSKGFLPTFIYAHMAPLVPTTPACLVQVRQCMIHPDGTADVMLLPVAYVRLERIWEQPDSGHLYEASSLRMGREQSRQMEAQYHRGGSEIMGHEFHQFAANPEALDDPSRRAMHAIVSYLLSAREQEEGDDNSE